MNTPIQLNPSNIKKYICLVYLLREVLFDYSLVEFINVHQFSMYKKQHIDFAVLSDIVKHKKQIEGKL